jgi:hypothetical protein
MKSTCLCLFSISQYKRNCLSCFMRKSKARLYSRRGEHYGFFIQPFSNRPMCGK